MIQNRLRSLISVQYPYPNPIRQDRARGLLTLLLVVLALWALVILLILVPRVLIEGIFNFSSLIMLVMPPLLVGMGIRFVQQGRGTASGLLLLMVLLPFTIVSVNKYGIGSSATLTLLLPMIAGGLLMNRRWTALLSIITIVGMMVFAEAEFRSLEPLFEPEYLPAFLSLFIITTLLLIFGGNYEHVVQQHVETTGTLQIVGRFAGNRTHKTELAVYTATLRLLRTELGHEFVQAFIADNQGRLVQRLRISLGVDETHVINRVSLIESSGLVEAARTQQPVLLTLKDDQLRRQHFIASIRYGLAVPIVVQGRTIAVIDIQTMERTFSAHNQLILSTLGEIVAGLVVNAQATSGYQEHIVNQDAAAASLRAEVRKLKQTERQVVGGDWETYLEQRRTDAIGFDADSEGDESAIITPAYNLPPELAQAMANGEVQITSTNEEQVVAVPIILQDEVLGAMTFSVPLDKVIVEKDLEAAQQIAQRLAIALENKRLFEQSQSQAFRERKAGEIAGLLIGATDVDAVLSLAADSFNEALGAVSTRIHLQPDVLEGPKSSRRGGILA